MWIERCKGSQSQTYYPSPPATRHPRRRRTRYLDPRHDCFRRSVATYQPCAAVEGRTKEEEQGYRGLEALEVGCASASVVAFRWCTGIALIRCFSVLRWGYDITLLRAFTSIRGWRGGMDVLLGEWKGSFELGWSCEKWITWFHGISKDSSQLQFSPRTLDTEKFQDYLRSLIPLLSDIIRSRHFIPGLQMQFHAHTHQRIHLQEQRNGQRHPPRIRLYSVFYYVSAI